MNNKGDVSAKLVVAVALLVLLIVLIFILVKVKLQATKLVEDSECKTSIINHATLLKTTGEAVATDIYCPTKYYTLPGKNDDEIKKGLAEAMKTCWGTWGKGQMNLFPDEGYYCNICYVIDFKDKSKKITGFSDYLTKTPIKPDDTMTYADYLAGYASEKADPSVISQFQEKGATSTIDTSKKYATIFLYAKGDSSMKRFLEGMDALGWESAGGGATTGAIIGIVIGIAASSTGIGAIAAVIGFVGGGLFGYGKSADVHWTSVIVFSEYTTDSVKKIGCEISPVKQDKAKDSLT